MYEGNVILSKHKGLIIDNGADDNKTHNSTRSLHSTSI